MAMQRPWQPRRSFLTGVLSALAGTWVWGAESLSALATGLALPGCDPRVKYGGPPPEMTPDTATVPAPPPSASAAVDPAATAGADAEDPVAGSARASGSAGEPVSAPPPMPASGNRPPPRPKDGGPPIQTKYGGPRIQTKYGGVDRW
jgi:hypothetical protein